MAEARIPVSRSSSSVRSIGLVVYPDVHIADIIGPQAIFETTSRLLQQQSRSPEYAYPVFVFGPSVGPVHSLQGISLAADRSYLDSDDVLDTLLVAGGKGNEVARNDPVLLNWLRRMAPRVRRFGSICTGAFIVANTGLFDGRRVTTHPSARKLLAESHPSIQVDPEANYVRDGNACSSAGATAGADMALALVGEDWGEATANETMINSWVCRSQISVSA